MNAIRFISHKDKLQRSLIRNESKRLREATHKGSIRKVRLDLGDKHPQRDLGQSERTDLLLHEPANGGLLQQEPKFFRKNSETMKYHR
jgi:hypothetical protein